MHKAKDGFLILLKKATGPNSRYQRFCFSL